MFITDDKSSVVFLSVVKHFLCWKVETSNTKKLNLNKTDGMTSQQM